MLHWTNVTGFLTWTANVNSIDEPHYLAQIDLAEMDIVVGLDDTGTWYVSIDGEPLYSGFPNPLTAQIHAMGLVLFRLGERSGNAARAPQTDDEHRCRALLEEIHARVKDTATLYECARKRLRTLFDSHEGDNE